MPPRRYAFVVLVLFLLSATLSLTRLGDAAFWDDEAQVGIIAKNLLAAGHLTAWDGRNLFAYRNGTLIDNTLRPINPPLDYAVTALSYRALGVSRWAGRAPFVLVGLGALALFFMLLRHDFPRQPKLQLYAFATLALSTNFLLDIRNCRYYALALFFSLLAWYAYRRCVSGGRPRDWLLLVIGMTLLFYSNYLLCAAFLLALAVALLLFPARAFTRADWLRLTAAVLLFAVCTVPYALHYHIWIRHDMPPPEPWFPHRPILFWWNLRELNRINALPWTLLLALVLSLMRSRKTRNESPIGAAWEWLTLAVGYVLMLSLLSPQPTEGASYADIRYLIPVIPLLAGLVGVVLWFMHQRLPLVAVSLFFVMITCNLLTLSPVTPDFQWLMPAYVAQVSHPYPTANAEAAAFLRRNANQDDLVLAAPEYENYPLMDSVGGKVKLCCLLDRHTPLPPQTIARLHAPLYVDENYPNWLIIFRIDSSTADMLRYFSRPHLENGRTVRYSYHFARRLPVYWDQTQRPEFPWHHFGPVTQFDPLREAVYIWKRDPARP